MPQSRLALDPTDVIALDHDGRLIDFRIASIGDAEARVIESLRQDRAAYDLPPGSPRPVSLSTPSVFGAPDFLFLDLPQLSEDQPAHRPLVAAHARPWPGEVAIYGSPEESAFALLATLPSRARARAGQQSGQPACRAIEPRAACQSARRPRSTAL